jgi:antitoxin YefM
MKSVSYSELRQNLKENLDAITDNSDLLVVHRPKGRSIIMMSLDEYNAWNETLHLNKSKANRKRLETAIENINTRTGMVKHGIIE